MKYPVIVLVLFSTTETLSGNWHYDDQNHWPDICRTGKSQSPINLSHKIAVKESFDKFIFSDYNLVYKATVKNNGHSVELKIDDVRPKIQGGGLPKEYTLDHLHFHWQSEHTMDDYRFPLEVHLVHYATDYKNLQNALKYKDGVAVLGVLFDLSPDDDVEFEPLMKVMKNVEQIPNSINMMNTVQLNSFLPRDVAGYFRYNGSLTTPNCTEAVIWTLFTNTISISKQQVQHFEAVHDDKGVLKANYRELQDLGSRQLYLKISPFPHHGSAKSIYEGTFRFTTIFITLLRIFNKI